MHSSCWHTSLFLSCSILQHIPWCLLLRCFHSCHLFIIQNPVFCIFCNSCFICVSYHMKRGEIRKWYHSLLMWLLNWILFQYMDFIQFLNCQIIFILTLAISQLSQWNVIMWFKKKKKLSGERIIGAYEMEISMQTISGLICGEMKKWWVKRHAKMRCWRFLNDKNVKHSCIRTDTLTEENLLLCRFFCLNGLLQSRLWYSWFYLQPVEVPM